MKSKTEIVQRVASHYVGDDCLQIMLGYKGNMALLSPSGLMYNDLPNRDYVHQYLEDERKKQFPYSNIPVHNRRISFSKYKFANHLLDFDTPYLNLSNQLLTENFAVKDGNQALLVSKICLPDDEQTKYLSRQELEDIFTTPPIENNERFIIIEDGLWETITFYSDEEILERYLERTREYIDDSSSWRFERLFKNASVEDIPEGYNLEKGAIVVNMDGTDITMQRVSVKFASPGCYKVLTSKIPMSKYLLEQLKGFAETYDCKEPKIKPRLNPNISAEEINSAKNMVKQLKLH